MSQFGFYIDSACCSGCKTCQVACKDKNDLDLGLRWRRVYEVSGGKWIPGQDGSWTPQLSTYNLSIACNHCETPSCAKACPTKALYKEEENGIVLIDPKKCVGCRYCEWACPYGALQYNNDLGIMSKCDFCKDYLEVGNKPSCVSSCPLRAIDFGELSDLQEKYGLIKQVHPMPEPYLTKPSLIIGPHPEAATAKSNNARIANLEEVQND
jgi:anaerobic dimethyl sulfoxide reductase subunit B (iron-sulfur subunit)